MRASDLARSYRMATEAKRAKVGDHEEATPPALQEFLTWCSSVGVALSRKVCVSGSGTVADYGMLAVEDIEEGEVLFTVPRAALLHHGSTHVAAVLQEERASLDTGSGWVPLLLALLYERTSPASRWRPYLSLWTDFRTLDQPMFWCRAERDRLLGGTGVPPAVDTDLDNIRTEYEDVVVPFIARHPDLWSPKTHNLELYTQLVAFVMAYSFQEPRDEDDEEEEEEQTPNPPMMVPMADMLNHVTDHNANLEFTPDSLKMVSVRSIRKGDEVFNTYGQMANWQLLHMYGFTETHESNRHDTADVPLSNFYKAAASGGGVDRQLRDERRDTLQQIMRDKTSLVFGKDGCLTDTELHSVLKVLSMSQEELTEFRENDGWEEDEEEEEEEEELDFSVEGLRGLKDSWKTLIHEATRLTVAAYGAADGKVESHGAADGKVESHGAADGKVESYGAADGKVESYGAADGKVASYGAADGKVASYGAADGKGRSSREQRSLEVRRGQIKILYKVMDAVAT